MMLGLARSERLYGGDVEEYRQRRSICQRQYQHQWPDQTKRRREIHRERACGALAVSALGYDARSFAGHDLLAAMADTAWVRNRATTRLRLRFWR